MILLHLFSSEFDWDWGFLNRNGAEIGYKLDKKMQQNHFYLKKN